MADKQDSLAPQAAKALKWTVGARTDTGRQRAANEDALAVLDPASLGLGIDAVFVVADGMGGMHAGDIASREAVRVVRETLVRHLSAPDADPHAALTESLQRANETVHALARDTGTPHPSGGVSDKPAGSETAASLMGTTCVAGVIKGGILHLAHVGDSRAYLLRDGRLSRLTRDHSFVEERVLAGDLTEEEARRSRFRNMITRAVGIEAAVEPDLRDEPLQVGDVLLVCTDGLTTMLSDADIEAVLERGAETGAADLDSIAGALVDSANRRGGADNITVVLVRGDVPADAASATSANEDRKERVGTRPVNVGLSPAVVDLDALPARRSRRRRSSPLVGLLAVVGLLSLLGAAAIGLSPGLRARAARFLAPAPASPPATMTATPDLSRLVYGPPQLFANYLARGNYLAYSPRGYLYFVQDTSGKVAALARSGEVLRSVAILPDAPPTATPIPRSRIFLTTDLQGNIYFSHTARRMIEKRSRDGRLLATISKDLQQPEALAVDEDGNLYVVDFNQIKILRARSPRPGTTASPPPAKRGRAGVSVETR